MFGRRRREELNSQADGRLRFVLFRPVGQNFTIDAIIDRDLTGRLGEPGTALTLRLHRPTEPRRDVEIEQVLRTWADEDRIVDVTLGTEAQSTTITALECSDSAMRVQLLP